MNAKRFLDDLRGHGVSIETDGERLLVDAPAGVVTGELRAALSEHKARVIGILKFEQRFQNAHQREQDNGRRFGARPSRHPGYTSLYDPVHGEWHDFPTQDCYPSIVELANKKRRKGGAA
jgi:hypothetical protein